MPHLDDTMQKLNAQILLVSCLISTISNVIQVTVVTTVAI